MLLCILFCIFRGSGEFDVPPSKPKYATKRSPDVLAIAPPKPVTTQVRSVNRSRNPPMSEIVPGLFIGDHQSSCKKPGLVQNNIKSILTVIRDPMNEWQTPAFVRIITHGRHLRIPTLDTSTQDLLIHMERACDFIEESMELGGVLVHCWQGVSRSTTFVIAYLMRRDRRSVEEVLADVKLKRMVRPNENFLAQLKLWGEMLYNVWLDKEKGIPKEPYARILKERGLKAGVSRAY